MKNQTKPLSVAEVFSKLGDGGVVEEIKDMFAEVSEAVLLTRKAGSVTIKIDVKPSKKGNKITMTDKLSCSVPKEDRDPTTFYVQEGSLFRTNPDQLALSEQEVE